MSKHIQPQNMAEQLQDRWAERPRKKRPSMRVHSRSLKNMRPRRTSLGRTLSSRPKP